MKNWMTMINGGCAIPFFMDSTEDGGSGAAGSGGGEGTGGGGMFSGKGGETPEDPPQGVLNTPKDGEEKDGANDNGAPKDAPADSIDWDNITDDEYFDKVVPPTVDGVTVDMDFIKKNYGEFLRKHHISRETLAEYIALEGGQFKKAYEEASARQDAEDAEMRKNFNAQGEELKKTYNPQQIDTAVKALSSLSDDKDFMKIATTNLSNNKTLVKLLLNWAEHNSVDDTAGAGAGAGGGGSLSGFAERWTGKKI